MTLGLLYHWSPRDRLNSIKRHGLTPGRRNINGPVFNGPGIDDDGEPIIVPGEWRAPYVCFSPDPATAWAYSHGTWRSTGTFDLWQVALEPTDECSQCGGVASLRFVFRIEFRRVVSSGLASESFRNRTDLRVTRSKPNWSGACLPSRSLRVRVPSIALGGGSESVQGHVLLRD